MIKKQTTVKTEHAVFKKKMIGKNVKNRDLIVKIVKKEDKSTPTPNKDMIFIKNCPIDILPLASMPKAKSMTPSTTIAKNISLSKCPHNIKIQS